MDFRSAARIIVATGEHNAFRSGSCTFLKRFALPPSGDAEAQGIMSSQTDNTVRREAEQRPAAGFVVAAVAVGGSTSVTESSNVARSPAPDASPPSSTQFRQLVAE